jgi:DNA polymerase III epsilon subunit-like protein
MAENPCWNGYEQIGNKMKNGKKVPNCVPIKRAKNLSTIEEQTQKIKDAALALIKDANSEFTGTRTVTHRAAVTIVERSIAKNESEPFSVRKHRALTELSQYITLAQQNRSLNSVPEHTDLLPVAHPRSTRAHDMTVASLMHYRARWVTDDPTIKDATVRTLLASALTAHPSSAEYEYSVARLESFPEGQIPQYALLAALGDGNSSLARRARAMRQRRDRKGRFAEMGGGLRALIRRINGMIQNLNGRAIAQGVDGDTFDVETPDGKIFRVPAANVEAIKAIIPSQQSKDGYGKGPAKVSAKDPVIDEADLVEVEAPEGFRRDDAWSPKKEDQDYYGENVDLGVKYTDDAYDVVKMENNQAAKDKFEMADQREREGQNVVAQGDGPNGELDPEKPVFIVNRRGQEDDRPFAVVQSWAEVQDFIGQDEPRFENNENPKPDRMGGGDDGGDEPPTSKTPKGGEFEPKYPPGNPQPGAVLVTQPDWEPRLINGDTGPLVWKNPDGSYTAYDFNKHGNLPGQRPGYNPNQGRVWTKEEADAYNRAEGKAPAERKPRAPRPGEKAPRTPEAEVPDVDGPNEFPKGTQIIPGTDKPSRAEMREYRRNLKDFKKNGGLLPLDPRKNWAALPDGSVVNADTGEILRNSKREVFLPEEEQQPGLIDRIKARLAPQGAHEVDRDEYQPEGPIDGQESPDFTDDPAELAQKYSKEELEGALEEAVEGTPEDPAPAFGQLPFEQGDEIVPAEALYNALKEQGVDVDKFLNDIYEQMGGKRREAPAENADVSPAPIAKLPTREIPPLIEGMTPEEQRDFIDNGDYKKYLPKNQEQDVPEGYVALDNDPFNEEIVEVPADAPEGFSYNPVDIALGYDKEELKRELRRSVEPANNMPGYGLLAQETPEGEAYQASVPGEAIRDALQLQGEDTNALLKDIYAEGIDNEPSNQQIADALEGENVQEEPAQAPQQAPQDAQGPDAAEPKAGLPADSTPQGDEGRAEAPEGVERLGSQEADLAMGEPRREMVAAKNLQPGDIAVRDNEFFVIEEVAAPADLSEGGQKDKGRNRINVKGYYPGHQTQDRDWFAEGKIEVIRGAAAPAKGNAEPLNKPKLEDYVGGRKDMKKIDGEWGAKDPAVQEKYAADLAAHKAAVQAASANFVDPTKREEDGFVDNAAQADALPAAAAGGPPNGPFIVKVKAKDLQIGDISTKDHFRIVDIKAGEGDKIIIVGHYPGQGLQEKQWKPDTRIEVYRGIPEDQAPQLGEGSLHRPAGRGPKGGWFPIDDTALNAEHEAKLAEVKGRWTPPENLPIVASGDINGENNLEDNLVAPEPPKGLPPYPAFLGKFAEWAKEAQGNWGAFRDKLKGQEVLVFDFETTGIGAASGNEPWQIAAVKMVDGKIVDRINIFMNPGRSIKGTYAGENAKDPDGNPLTDEFFADKPSQAEGLAQFLEWAGANPLAIAQNAKFDDEIMKRKAAELGLEWNPAGMADTMGMAAEIFKDAPGAPGKKGLGAIADFLGIKNENWHDGANDAEVTAQAFTKLIDLAAEGNFGAGALDADAQKAAYDAKMAAAQPRIDAYNAAVAEFLGKKALRDGLAGKEVNLPELQKLVSAPLPEGPIDNVGAMDNPDEAPRPRADLVDVEIDSAFPEGKMRIAEPDFANDFENVEQLFRGDIKANDLRPGDFVKPNKDKDEFFQVVSIRGGEEFGVEEFKRRVVVQNAAGEQKVMFWNQNAFLDEVRRPKDRKALAGEPLPEVVRTPEEVNMQAVTVAYGNAVLEIVKDGVMAFLAKGRILDNEGNEIYTFEGRYITPEAAEAEAKAYLRQAGQNLAEMARRREGKPESTEKSMAVGVEPANVDQLPVVEVVEDLPVGEGQNEITPRVEGDAVVFQSDAKVVDEGEVLAQVVEEFPSKKEASEGGRNNIDAMAEALADQIKAQRDELLLRTDGRGRRNLPPIPEKYRRQVFLRMLAGLYADSNGNPLAIGDKVIHENPEKAAKYGEGVVVGKVQGRIGGLQRKGVVYVDYVRVQYPDGTIRKYASRFQRHVDGDVAKQRFDAEPRINWMNQDEMDIALAERRKKPRKGNEAVDAADAEVEEVVQDVKNVADGAVAEPAEGEDANKPSYEHDINWFKQNVEPQQMAAGDIKVGDFLPTKGDKNIGRVVAIEDLDRAVRIEVEYPNGRRWTYNPMAKGFNLDNVYRIDGAEKPEAPATPEVPAAEAPQAPAVEAPAVEAPEIAGDPFVDLNDVEAIKKKLEGLAALLPKFRATRKERNARWTRRRVDELIERMAYTPIDKLDNYELRDAISYANRIVDPALKAQVLPELEKLRDNVFAKKDEIRQVRQDKVVENLKRPFDENLIPAGPEVNALEAAIVAVVERLPEDPDADIDRNLNRAKDNLVGLRNAISGRGEGSFDRINARYMKDAIDNIRAGRLDADAQEALAVNLEKINEIIVKQAAEDRAIRQAKYIERLNQPLADDLFPTNEADLDRDKIKNAIDGVIALLPTMEERDADDDLYRAGDNLRDFRRRLDGQDPDQASDYEFVRAIADLRRANDPRQNEIADKLEAMRVLIEGNKAKFRDERLAEYNARLAKPFDENLVIGDPADFNKAKIEAIFEALAEKLPQDNEIDADRQVRRAGEYARKGLVQIQNIANEDEEAGLRAFDDTPLRKIIDKVNANGNEQEKQIAEFAQKALDQLVEKKNLLKGEARDKFLARRNVEMPENIAPAEGRESKQDFMNFLEEIIDRLPKDEDEEADARPVRALRALRNYRDEVNSAADPLKAMQGELSDAIDNLKNANDGKYREFAQELLDMQGFIAQRLIDRPLQPFAGVNLEEVDPIALAEERVAKKENPFKASPELQAEFANEELFKNEPFLAPFKDQLQGFFNGEDNPLAQLDMRARQALGQKVAAELKSGKKLPPERIKELAALAIALHAERDVYQPQRNDVGPAGRRLLSFDPQEIMEAARKTKGDVELVLNGNATGFKGKKLGGGINGDYTFIFTDIATGQQFILKKERSQREARAEYEAARIAQALGIGGRVMTELFPNNPAYLIQTMAGDAVRLDAKPDQWGAVGGRMGNIENRANMVDLIAVALLDAVINNTDRHSGNFLAAEADKVGVQGNGHEDIFLLPIDHGFAALLNGGATGGLTDAVNFIFGGNGRTLGSINRDLAKKLGGEAYKELADMTIQQAIQYLQRVNGGELRPDMLKKVIERLEALRGIDVSQWQKWAGK